MYPKLKTVLQRCNNFLCSGSSKAKCVPFLIEEHNVGIIRPDILQQLLRYPDTFILEHRKNGTTHSKALHLTNDLDTYQKRSSRLKDILNECRLTKDLLALNGWRNEQYYVWAKGREKPMMEIERSASGCFGILTYGVHINGYVNHPTNGLCLWVGRRSKNKLTYPGMLDSMAAGGLSVGTSIIECAVKECQEEASIPESYFKKLKPTGAVSFCLEDARGIYPECMYTFDLELDTDFVPKPADGEVDEFMLLSCNRIMEQIISEEFKPSSAPILLDFLLRHGIISPDYDGYSELIMGLHLKLPLEI